MKRVCCLALFCFLGWTQLGVAAPTTFTINHFQWFDGRSCEEHLVEIERNLEETSGFEVDASLCRFDKATERTHLAFRVADSLGKQKISTYSASTYDPRGFYESLDQCEAAKEKEMELFEDQTGVAPSVAFCASERIGIKRPWYVHVVGFGKDPKKVPYRASWIGALPYGETYSEIFIPMKERMTRYGFHLTHLAFRNRSLGGGATAQFYSNPQKDRPSFGSELVVSVQGLRSCLGVKESLTAELEANADTFALLTTLCTSPYSEPHTFDLNVSFVRKGWVDVEYSSQSFKSLDSCEGARAEIVRKTGLFLENRKIVGSVCGGRPYSSEAHKKIFRVGMITTRL